MIARWNRRTFMQVKCRSTFENTSPTVRIFERVLWVP